MAWVGMISRMCWKAQRTLGGVLPAGQVDQGVVRRGEPGHPVRGGGALLHGVTLPRG